MRLRSQRLVGEPLPNVEHAVEWLGAVQAQDYPGAAWAVAQRTPGATRADVDAALDAGTVLRTHVLRPTWHLVRPADLMWMLALTASRVRATMAGYDRALGIDDAVRTQSAALIAGALADGRHRTRAELAGALADGGIEARGPRLAHLVMHAELDALICSGVRRGTSQTYALVDQRVPPAAPLSRDEALAALAWRYVRSHAPATPHDFAWWSGLTVADARRGLAALGTDVDVREWGGTAHWLPSDAEPVALPTPCVHLLPNYDEHVVAYRDHGPSLDPGAPAALDGWGTAATGHQIVRDGLVVGSWRRTLHRDRVDVQATIHVPLRPAERAALRGAAEAFGRFLGLDARLTVRHRGEATERE